jgi:Tfp pilus assembly protein PilN
MIMINLVPQARRRRRTQLTREDRTLIFVVAAVLMVLLASYVYARVIVYRTQAHLTDLQQQIAALDGEQQLLDLNRQLAQQSLAMEKNLAASVQSQVDLNRVLDDVAQDQPRAVTLTSFDVTPLDGRIQMVATGTNFIDLVRFFNALLADTRFQDVRIEAYSIPYGTGQAGAAALDQKATMNLSLTWKGGGSNG